MPTISLRVSEEELKLFQDFAKLNQTSLSELIRRTMLSKLEDEYDLQVFSAYEAAKACGKVKSYSHEEAWAELGLCATACAIPKRQFSHSNN